jgi:proprotein convertase subtilisin/kexin type 2
MLLGKRAKDEDSRSGFTKWPFMTTQSWAENPRGRWKLFVIFDSDEPQTGTMNEWTLLLHGTRDSPYVNQKADLIRHSKLAVVKREHETGRNFQY